MNFQDLDNIRISKNMTTGQIAEALGMSQGAYSKLKRLKIIDPQYIAMAEAQPALPSNPKLKVCGKANNKYPWSHKLFDLPESFTIQYKSRTEYRTITKAAYQFAGGRNCSCTVATIGKMVKITFYRKQS